MTEFEQVYNRLFNLRGADTKHMADCEEIWAEAREACALIVDRRVRAIENDSQLSPCYRRLTKAEYALWISELRAMAKVLRSTV